MRFGRLVFGVLTAACGSAYAGNFAECILEKMPGAANEAVLAAVAKTCNTAHPEWYYEVRKGSGIGWFGPQTPEECTIKIAGSTTYQRAAGMVSQACACLYSKPARNGEMCAVREPAQSGLFDDLIPKPVASSTSTPQGRLDVAHPGWGAIIRTEMFRDWVHKQPATFRRLIEEKQDHDQVSRILDLFKRDRADAAGRPISK